MGILNLVVGLLTGAAVLLFPTTDIETKLLNEAAEKVVTLTPPSRTNTGGTGFHVKAPSGLTYILTNAHVCGLAEDGFMAVHRDHYPDRQSMVMVIEVSKTADLCILSPITKVEGFDMADSIDGYESIYSVGHPRLEANTLSKGHVTARRPIALPIDATPNECAARGGISQKIITFFGIFDMCVKEFDSLLTSLVIYPGSSGSPVFNKSGEVVGVVFAGNMETNYGAIVPTDEVNAFLTGY